MPASQLFSGNGDPNGVVEANPGDLYQDQTGKLWVNTAAPSTWAQLSTGGGGATSLYGGVRYDAQFDAAVQIAKSDGSPYPVTVAITVDAPGEYTATISALPPANYAYELVVNPRSLTGNTVITTDVSAIGDAAFTVRFWNAAGDTNVAPAYFVAQLLLVGPFV